jgi:hypothetical protein
MSTDQKDWLKFHLGDKAKVVDAETFIDVFQNIIAALKSIDKTLSTYGTETIQWQIIDAGSNSPIFATISGKVQSANNGYGKKVIDTFVTGLEQLSRSKSCPPHFNKDSLQFVQNIVTKAKQHGLQPKFSTPIHKVKVARNVARNANWAMKTLAIHKSRYTEYGTFEGYLRELNVARNRDKLVIVDALTEHAIPCYFKQLELEDDVRKAWKRRVIVTGEITVDNETKQPIKIVIDEIKILRDRENLPQIEDLQGIDITSGIEPSEYIRGLRDVE